MNRKNAALILGLLLVGSLSTAAWAEETNAPVPAVVKVEGTVVSVTAVCPAAPTTPATPATPADPAAPCGGQAPVGYDVLVQTKSGEQKTLSFAANATLDEGKVTVAQIPANAKVEFTLLDGKVASVEVEIPEGKHEDDKSDQVKPDDSSDDADDDQGDVDHHDDGDHDDGNHDDGNHDDGNHDDGNDD